MKREITDKAIQHRLVTNLIMRIVEKTYPFSKREITKDVFPNERGVSLWDFRCFVGGTVVFNPCAVKIVEAYIKKGSSQPYFLLNPSDYQKYADDIERIKKENPEEARHISIPFIFVVSIALKVIFQVRLEELTEKLKQARPSGIKDFKQISLAYFLSQSYWQYEISYTIAEQIAATPNKDSDDDYYFIAPNDIWIKKMLKYAQDLNAELGVDDLPKCIKYSVKHYAQKFFDIVGNKRIFVDNSMPIENYLFKLASLNQGEENVDNRQ